MTIRIGLVGKYYTGKSTFAALLGGIVPDKVIAKVSPEDILNDTLAVWHMPKTQENRNQLAQCISHSFNGLSFSYAFKKRILATEADIIIIDEIGWETDLITARDAGLNLLFEIAAEEATRYQRFLNITKRESITLQEFTYKNKDEEMDRLIPLTSNVDAIIRNDGTLEEFRNKMTKVTCDKILPALQSTPPP